MELEQIARQLERRAQQRGLHYWLGPPAPEAAIAHAEQQLGVVFPAQINRFYRHYNGLRVEAPFLEVLPLEQLALTNKPRLHFAVIDHAQHLYFDISHRNAADQWDIITAGGARVTFTLASFWSNKLWAWVDKKRPIWHLTK